MRNLENQGFGKWFCEFLVIAYDYFMPHHSLKNWEKTTVTARIQVNAELVDEGEEKSFFNGAMLSTIASKQKAPLTLKDKVDSAKIL
ncbi:MAG: hypothetical protein JSW44_04545 [Candidatus Bathyarchaeota archaeon]|nr:MAG: hypothetical protein JSW44_04545 [Candidatus Bathyarchaeota archaeon]